MSVGKVVATIIVAVVVIGGIILFTSTSTGTAGSISVVRNGGPLDNRNIREETPLIEPGAGISYIGFLSTTHPYPAQQRFYTISTDQKLADSGVADTESAPTSDGVQLGIDSTVYFNLNLDQTALEQFDSKYGVRTYPDRDGNQHYPWEGDEGWSAFLNNIVRPVISNAFRQQIGSFRCAQLVSSCALVQNNGAAVPVDPTKLGDQQNNANLNAIQEALNLSLQADLNSALGGEYLTGIRVNISKLTLPENVQAAVNQAQAAFAQVTEAQAKVESAKAEAEANRQRQRGYQDCPACAQIDTLKAIPPNVTTFAPGSNFAVTQGGN